jgi:WD40 repeat protein
MRFELDAYVTQVLFEADGEAACALGDGQVRWAGGAIVTAHDGAILAAVRHPAADGVITGGDDGRVVWSRRSEAAQVVAEARGRWVESLAVQPGSSLLALAVGREARVVDLANPGFERSFAHDRTVAGLALDARARRLAVATYGGVALWYARIAEQQPVMLKWAGSHIDAAFSPDGRFVISSMQESALHGWRLADARDMRMGGYPSKVRSLVFLDRGRFLATSGANGAVIWPFAGADGPMGKQAAELGFDERALVSRVAAEAEGTVLVAGLADGRIWAAEIASGRLTTIKPEPGPPISALAVSQGYVAWGDEGGGAGVEPLPAGAS